MLALPAGCDPGGAISVRDLDEDVASRLKLRAARHGRSMEAEVRAILTDAVAGGGEMSGSTLPRRSENASQRSAASS